MLFWLRIFERYTTFLQIDFKLLIMKYFLWVGYVLVLYTFLGFLNNEFVVFVPVFSVSIFLSVLLLHFRSWKLNSYFLLLSFPLFLAGTSLFIDGAWSKSYLSIFGYILAVFFGITCCNVQTLRKKFYLSAALGVVLFVLMVFVHPNVFYATNYKTDFSKHFDVPIKDTSGKPITFAKDTLYVLDFWTTSCAICIEKFPEFSNLATEYDEKKIRFLAVNVPLNVGQNNALMNKLVNREYAFEHAFLSNENDASKINIHDYPTILVVADGKIVYNGFPAYESYVFKNSIRGVIDHFLE